MTSKTDLGLLELISYHQKMPYVNPYLPHLTHGEQTWFSAGCCCSAISSPLLQHLIVFFLWIMSCSSQAKFVQHLFCGHPRLIGQLVIASNSNLLFISWAETNTASITRLHFIITNRFSESTFFLWVDWCFIFCLLSTSNNTEYWLTSSALWFLETVDYPM